MKRYLVWILYLSIVLAAMSFQTMMLIPQQLLRRSNPESTLGYTLRHPLHTVNATSDQVRSQLILSENGKRIQQVEVSAPVRSFDSGNRARDRDMMKVTEADKYPDVTFKSSQVSDQNGLLAITGKLSFHGVAREISFKAQQQWKGNKLVVDGGFNISLEAYDIKRPAIFTMKVKDNLQVRFHMVY